MYIKINNRIFENATWNVNEGIGKLSFNSNEPLSDLEQFFEPTNAITIERYDDNDELVEKWYNKNLQELSYLKQDGQWGIVAKFEVSSVNETTEEDIRSSIEDADDALIEIAQLISDAEEQMEELVEGFGERVRAIDSEFEKKVEELDAEFIRQKNVLEEDINVKKSAIDKTIEDFQRDLATYKDNLLKNVNDEMAEFRTSFAEQKATLDRLDALYNNLADRVAALENK